MKGKFVEHFTPVVNKNRYALMALWLVLTITPLLTSSAIEKGAVPVNMLMFLFIVNMIVLQVLTNLYFRSEVLDIMKTVHPDWDITKYKPVYSYIATYLFSTLAIIGTVPDNLSKEFYLVVFFGTPIASLVFIFLANKTFSADDFYDSLNLFDSGELKINGSNLITDKKKPKKKKKLNKKTLKWVDSKSYLDDLANIDYLIDKLKDNPVDTIDLSLLHKSLSKTKNSSLYEIQIAKCLPLLNELIEVSESSLSSEEACSAIIETLEVIHEANIKTLYSEDKLSDSKEYLNQLRKEVREL